MQTIVFATHNEDKLKEIRAIVNDIPGMEEFNIISMAAAGKGQQTVQGWTACSNPSLIR